MVQEGAVCKGTRRATAAHASEGSEAAHALLKVRSLEVDELDDSDASPTQKRRRSKRRRLSPVADQSLQLFRLLEEDATGSPTWRSCFRKRAKSRSSSASPRAQDDKDNGVGRPSATTQESWSDAVPNSRRKDEAGAAAHAGESAPVRQPTARSLSVMLRSARAATLVSTTTSSASSGTGSPSADGALAPAGGRLLALARQFQHTGAMAGGAPPAERPRLSDLAVAHARMHPGGAEAGGGLTLGASNGASMEGYSLGANASREFLRRHGVQVYRGGESNGDFGMAPPLLFKNTSDDADERGRDGSRMSALLISSQEMLAPASEHGPTTAAALSRLPGLSASWSWEDRWTKSWDLLEPMHFAQGNGNRGGTGSLRPESEEASPGTDAHAGTPPPGDAPTIITSAAELANGTVSKRDRPKLSATRIVPPKISQLRGAEPSGVGPAPGETLGTFELDEIQMADIGDIGSSTLTFLQR